MLGDGSGIGPVEAVVAQLAIGFSALSWSLAAVLGESEWVALAPLIGVVWVVFRYRARSSEQVEQETEPDPEQVRAEMSAQGGD